MGRCSEYPGGRASQLRKLRSGLFPNKRYPGWTVGDVRRPSLDEATTLVVGLGRTMMGPTIPKKQRVAPQASALERGDAWVAKTGGLALQRWDRTAGYAGCVWAPRSASKLALKEERFISERW